MWLQHISTFSFQTNMWAGAVLLSYKAVWPYCNVHEIGFSDGPLPLLLQLQGWHGSAEFLWFPSVFLVAPCEWCWLSERCPALWTGQTGGTARPGVGLQPPAELNTPAPVQSRAAFEIQLLCFWPLPKVGHRTSVCPRINFNCAFLIFKAMLCRSNLNHKC